MSELINLDGMDRDDLLAFVAARPDAVWPEKALVAYAKAKADAMRLRGSGRTQLARRMEDYCQGIYQRLPDALRW